MNCSYFNKRFPNYKFVDCRNRNFSCVSMWETNQDEFRLVHKGCWPSEHCQSNLAKNTLFCCCDGSNCNKDLNPDGCLELVKQRLVWNKILNVLKESFDSIMPTITANYVLIISLLVFLLLFIVLIVCFNTMDGKKKKRFIKRIKSMFSASKMTKYEENKLNRIDCDEIKREIIKLANGSHSDIYKGRIIRKKESLPIAIKIFKLDGQAYFKNEFQVYNLPAFKHQNVLEFVKAKRSLNELWLMTKYKENGSLLDYLKKNTVNLNQLFQICLDISNGLSYLHNSSDYVGKRVIVHNDIRPSNILLNSQLNASISDFELSKVFYNSKPLFDERIYENTINLNVKNSNFNRYTSPELLNGSICFQTYNSLSIEQLVKSDVYSCALVFWEILNRLDLSTNNFYSFQNQATQINNEIRKYKMVYEHCKCYEKLIDYVVNNRGRPDIEEKWRESCLLNAFCQKIEMCWDANPNSRLSASRLYHNIKELESYLQDYS